MIKIIIFIVVAAVGGVGAGLYLRPVVAQASDNSQPDDTESTESDATPEEAPEYVKMSNQFIIPVVKDGRVSSMVIMSLSLEAQTGASDAIFAKEPKLRDAFLQVLFDHANVGGFSGNFTDGANLIVLRRALLEVAQSISGPTVLNVLISDIGRQDG